MFHLHKKVPPPPLKLALLLERHALLFFCLLFVTFLLLAPVPGSHQGGTLRCCLRRSWGRSWHNSPGTPQSDCGRVAFSEVPWHQSRWEPSIVQTDPSNIFLAFPLGMGWQKQLRATSGRLREKGDAAGELLAMNSRDLRSFAV